MVALINAANESARGK